MRQILNRLPSPATVMSALALFISLGGVSYGVATGSIDSREIKNNSIRSKDVRNGQINAQDVRNGSLSSLDLRDNGLTGADINESTLALPGGSGGGPPTGSAGGGLTGNYPRPLIAPNGVSSANVVDESLTGADINESTLALPGGSGGGAPTGSAGGGLTGNYPNPLIAPNAVSSANVADGSLTGGDIADGSLGNADVADGSLTGGKIAAGTLTSELVQNGSLTGADIATDSLNGANVQESTLGQVPSALTAALGGTGRFAGTGSCDPESDFFIPCSVVTLNLPAPSRVFALGRMTARTEINSAPESDSDTALGTCRIATSSGAVANSDSTVYVDDDSLDPSFEQGSVIAVTGVLPAGNQSIGLDCNQGGFGAINFVSTDVVALALSAG